MRTSRNEKVNEFLRLLGTKSIEELETDRGILASGRDEAYGCIFGRDSLISSFPLLRVFERTGDIRYAKLVEKILRNLALLQGKEVNIESGEEPGKCIHEYRPDRHEHLTGLKERPWHLYPNNEMRNYDTVDATQLFLMAIHEHGRVTGDGTLALELQQNIEAALRWLLEFGDSNGDGFIDYRFHSDRMGGGLITQSWMDSSDSVFYERSDMRPPYPIAPVEAQAYAFAALRQWAPYFAQKDAAFSLRLACRADELKKAFNREFISARGSSVAFAYALDGDGRPLLSPRSSLGHCLWAVWRPQAGVPESILDKRFIDVTARRLLARDMFVPGAGLRTLSSRSNRFDPVSYHNGSIWPHDTFIFAEGLETFGYAQEAQRVRKALRRSYAYFKTPIELFGYKDKKFMEYRESSGRGACRVQAWSAASLLALVTEQGDTFRAQ